MDRCPLPLQVKSSAGAEATSTHQPEEHSPPSATNSHRSRTIESTLKQLTEMISNITQMMQQMMVLFTIIMNNFQHKTSTSVVGVTQASA
ncbi:hypothetical protein AVEN_211831-1 [Araneus ventricosus]|uniref:Uncharacterized protein n=1 Tax=Araneus ventricosus TaxID=182803 RepID=A0A4Y2HHW2_ARAVE|nr:hypothetical protein AVEN_211831-1 [Araneus ventricosus]